jgi:DNA repair protein RecO (recombination protein O)
MSTEKTEAIVIRQADFSETSRVVTFYTREFGKVPLVAKGAKRLKGPFESSLDLLSVCEIVFIRKSSDGLGILTEARLNQRFQNTGKELLRLYGGYYIAELLEGLNEEFDPHPDLYEATIHSMRRLDDAASAPRLAIILFELALLREIGHLPNFETCLKCGQPTTERAPFAYWVSQGGLLCRNCQTREYKNNRIGLEAVRWLRDLSEPEPIEPEHLDEKVMREMSNVTTSAVTYDLGHRPRTLRYLQSIH